MNSRLWCKPSGRGAGFGCDKSLVAVGRGGPMLLELSPTPEPTPARWRPHATLGILIPTRSPSLFGWSDGQYVDSPSRLQS